MRGGALLVCMAAASVANAQPAPMPNPPPSGPQPFDGKVRDVDDPANKHPVAVARRDSGEHAWKEPPFRYAWGGGISGPVLDYNGLYQGTAGFEGAGFTRVNTWTALGLHFHLSLRNWTTIRDYYSALANQEHHDGAEAYGYLFGWLAGTGMIAMGPEVMLGRAKESRGWVSFGTSFFIFIDTNDARLKDGVALGHGAKFATGIDINREIGIGFQLRWAPSDGATIFGTTGPSILAMMATIEVRADYKDKKKK